MTPARQGSAIGDVAEAGVYAAQRRAPAGVTLTAQPSSPWGGTPHVSTASGGHSAASAYASSDGRLACGVPLAIVLLASVSPHVTRVLT